MLWRTRCGLPWRDLPPQYRHWKTVYNRDRRWSGDGTWVGILEELRRDADAHEGPDWTVGIDGGVLRAHQHAAGARHEPPADVPARRSSQRPSWTQGAGSNDKKSAAKPAREWLGRSRGGLISKIHPTTDTRCHPISRVTTAGHRHDSLAFEPVMAGIRIHRRGRGRPRTRPAQVLGDKVYSSRAIRSTCDDVGSGRPSRSRPTNGRTGCGAGAQVPDHPRRRRGVQAAQRHRAGDQQTQGPPGGRHPLRQARFHFPRNHQRRFDQDLASRPRPMIQGTPSSRCAPAPNESGARRQRLCRRARAGARWPGVLGPLVTWCAPRARYRRDGRSLRRSGCTAGGCSPVRRRR